MPAQIGLSAEDLNDLAHVLRRMTKIRMEFDISFNEPITLVLPISQYIRVEWSKVHEQYVFSDSVGH